MYPHITLSSHPAAATGSFIANAVAAADKRSSPRDVAAALVRGLALLRNAVGEQADYTSQKSLDDLLTQSLIARDLSDLQAGAVAPARAPLPMEAPSTTAQTIIEETVRSCLLLDQATGNHTFLRAAAIGLLDALIEHLHGVPEASALIRAIAPEDDDRDDATTLVARVH